MIRVTSEWTGGQGTPYYTTMHFGGSSSGEAGTAANAVRNFWFQLENQLGGDLTVNVLDDVPLINVTTGQIEAMFNAPTAPVAFTSTEQPLPWTTQALFRLRTGVFVNGRELRGKVFIPGNTENRSLDGVPDNAWQTLLNGNWTFAFGGLAGSNAVQVWSPTHGVADNVQSATVWEQWASLRSRRD